MDRNWLRALPLILLLLVSAMLATGLFNRPPESPTASAGKKMLAFDLPTLSGEAVRMTPNGFSGHTAILNVFASWCVPCTVEHPVLMKLAQSGKVQLYGLAWKDTPEHIAAWLAARGNPYRLVGIDRYGQTTVALGLTGAPETFVLDRDGNIYYHLKAPLTDDDINQIILPLVERLNAPHTP